MDKKYSTAILYCFLFIVLLADFSYSFVQHLSMPLDGDMAAGIVPQSDVQKILNDPFGLSVITENAVYPNPNRFFCHMAFYSYFNYIPNALQIMVNPTQSVYLSCAIIKIAIQLLLTVLILFYVTGNSNVTYKHIVLVALLITPLFQTNGYVDYMGIINPSVTYTFFYALPITLLLLFYFPFYNTIIYNRNFPKSVLSHFFLLCLCMILPFSGPLIPGVGLIVIFLFCIYSFIATHTKNKTIPFFKKITETIKTIPNPHIFYFSLFLVLSIYSFYIGTNNSIFSGENITIIERYKRLPLGLFTLFSEKVWFALLISTITINIVLMKRLLLPSETKMSLTMFKWVGLFMLLYILLLPLGGYKPYRPHILRCDTMIPVSIGLIYVFVHSSFLLVQEFVKQKTYSYFVFLFLVLFVFTIADEPEFSKNKCQKDALLKIAASKDSIVALEIDCNILSWDKITDYRQSELNARLLKKWNIISANKLYYQY